ncbi:pirin-like isoform X2 [Glandiceps talaboti]
MSRTVEKSVVSVPTEEGLGVVVNRSIGRPELEHTLFDPFLLLDEFKAKEPAGFPDHPHRGFETVTYVISGETSHEDFLGNEGTLRAGDLQWMTAGRGIVHSEMPTGTIAAHGLQLWVNLSKEYKMSEPHYQNLRNKDIPKVSKDGVTVKVIAGESMGVKSQVRTRTPTMFLDFKLKKGAKMQQDVQVGWTAFVYVLSGKAYFGPLSKQVVGQAHTTLVLSDGNCFQSENKDSKLCHFVLIAGPFVMNDEEETKQAWIDYTKGKNGFENAPKWNSKVGLEYLEEQSTKT